jgi:hypothetical protein
MTWPWKHISELIPGDMGTAETETSEGISVFGPTLQSIHKYGVSLGGLSQSLTSGWRLTRSLSLTNGTWFKVQVITGW